MSTDRIRMISHSYADEANTNAQNLTVREIARRLDPERFEITLFARDEPDPRLLGSSNVRILRFGAHGKALKFLSRSLFGGFAVNFYVRNEWVDSLYLRARPLLARRQVAVYHVTGAIGERRQNPRDFDAFARGITRCQVVACNSDHVAATVESRFGFRPPVVRNGVDFERFHPGRGERRRERPRVLFAASLQPRKRPDLVLEVAARLAGADFRIVGSGPLAGAIASRARELSNVAVLASVPQATLANEMREADVFLLTSSSPVVEGAPQVLAQAAASGLPVVAFDAYRPEAVIDGKTGFVVRDDREMMEKLRLVVERPDLRDQMGEAGVQFARRRFDWGAIVRQWEDLIAEAVARACAA